MGNRRGSPPSQYDDEETDNQPETDETTQTGITDSTQTEPEGEERSGDEPDKTEDPDESQVGGGGGGGPVDVSTEPESSEQPAESDEDNRESGPEAENKTENEEQDDTEEDEFEFVYGDIVHDREEEPSVDEVPDDLVVVNLPDGTISEWECDEDKTLAEQNPGYPPTDDVVIVVELEMLQKEMPEWDEREEEYQLDTLDEESMDYDCYPSLRLELQEPSHLRIQ